MNRIITRRAFIERASAVGLGVWLGTRVGFSQSKSPNDKLNIGIIGTANRASSNIAGVKSQNIVALTEAVLLGNVAFRAGKKLEWYAANLKVTNCPEAMKFIRREYRNGWAI